jgi:hypothetical protein
VNFHRSLDSRLTHLCLPFCLLLIRWYTIHNLHNGGAIALGLMSMYYNDDSVFNERIPILWSIGYFVVDLVDCGLRGDVTYSLHALFCLVLGLSNYTTPVCRELRMKYVTLHSD